MDTSPQGLYILNPDHSVSQAEDVIQWAKAFERESRRVALTHLPYGVTVSTVFIGIDHNWSEFGHPVLFETMVFGGPYDEAEQRRYSTWDEAIAGHDMIVALCGKVPVWQHVLSYFIHKMKRIMKRIKRIVRYFKS